MKRLLAALALLPAFAAAARAQDVFAPEEDQREIMTVAFSPDGKQLVTAGTDGSLRLWDLEKKAIAAKLKGAKEVTCVRFLPDGKQLVVAEYYTFARLWDLEAKKAVKSVEFSNGLNHIAVAPDGKKAYLAGRDAAVFVWDLQAGDGGALPTLKSDDEVHSLSLSKDGKILVHTDAKGGVYLWKLPSGELVKQQKHGRLISVAALAPDEKTFATASQGGGVKLWNAATGEPVPEFANDAFDVRSLAWTSDGKAILIGDAAGKLKAVNPATGAVMKETEAHGDAVLSIMVSPDGTRTATSSADFAVKIWKTEDVAK